MNKFLFCCSFSLLLFTNLFFAQSQDDDVISKNKKFIFNTLEEESLQQFVQKLIDEKKLKENPIIVLDERVVSWDFFKVFKPFSYDKIEVSVFASNSDKLIPIYGKQSTNGVVIIDTIPQLYTSNVNKTPQKVLYIVDGKAFNGDSINVLNPNKIESLKVIKNKIEIKKYTTEDYSGVILITLKK